MPSEIAPAHALQWFTCLRPSFNDYRQWWALFDGQPIQELLAQHDIIQAAHFPLDGNLVTDFARSRSAHDADALRDVLRKAINRMAPRGVVFLGNLWDLDKKNEFVASSRYSRVSYWKCAMSSPAGIDINDANMAPGDVTSGDAVAGGDTIGFAGSAEACPRPAGGGA